jgi:hypothetical protein
LQPPDFEEDFAGIEHRTIRDGDIFEQGGLETRLF